MAEHPEDNSPKKEAEAPHPYAQPPLYPSHEDLEMEDFLKAQKEQEALDLKEREAEEQDSYEPPEHDYENPTTGFEYDYVQHTLPSEIPKVLPSVSGPSVQQAPSKAAKTKAIADVKIEPVPWLWPRRIALGTLCIVDGDPELGKTTIVIDLMARLSRGRAMPFEAQPLLPAVNCLILTAEDSIANTIAPRVTAAGADTTRVFAVTEPMVFPTDVQKLKETIIEKRARLVMIDPLLAMLEDKIEVNQDAKMRQVLAPLAAVAAHTESAIVLVRHLNKSLHSKTMYRGGGSISIAAAARTALLAAQAKGVKHFANYKSNLDVKAVTLVYEIVDNGAGVAIVSWKDVSSQSADDVMDASLPPGYRSKVEERVEKRRSQLEGQLIAAVQKLPGLTKRDIRDLKLGSRERVDKALDKLVEEGFLKLNPQEGGGKGGRPTHTYDVAEDRHKPDDSEPIGPQEDFGPDEEKD